MEFNLLNKKPIKQTHVIDRVLQLDEVFENENWLQPDMIKLRKHLVGEGRLEPELILKIIELAEQIFLTEPNLIRLESPANLVGDIHGQFYDLLTVFSLGGSPDAFKYLFFGDFVDRGMFSLECVCYLYCLKIKYPGRVFMLRGNHECRHLTQFFTFHEECLHKSSQLVYDRCMKSFDSLPLCAVLDSKFCRNSRFF